MKNIYIFIFFLFIAIINGLFFNFLNDSFFHLKDSMHDDISKEEMAFLAVLVAPFLETLFFQFLFYKVLTGWLGLKNDVVCILIMSLAFSQMHWYNWLYVVMTFFGGLILNTFYITFRGRTRYYFMLTVLFHALYNLYGVLFVK
jgi:hypothetical protein